jgi:hypothetical protein
LKGHAFTFLSLSQKTRISEKRKKNAKHAQQRTKWFYFFKLLHSTRKGENM